MRCRTAIVLFYVLLVPICAQAQTVAPPNMRPAAVTAGVVTQVVVTVLITSSSLPVIVNGVNVLQVEQDGGNARVIGTLNDSGTNGDSFAGDGIFGGTLTLNQTSAGQVYLQISAAFKGTLRRTLSPVRSVLVTPPGVPNTPQPSTTLTTTDPQTGVPVVCNELLVTFKTGTSQLSINSAIASVGGKLIGMLAQLGVYQITIPACNGTSLRIAQAVLAANPIINYAELDGIGAATQITGSPNDPYYRLGEQWGLGTINASQAWSLASGVPEVKSGVTIGIIDSGINANHEDLLGEVWPGLDWCSSVVNNICVGVGTNTADDNGHGTWVAGIAAAITDNGVGVASPAYSANLIAEKVDPPNQPDNYPADAVANAITDAVSRGARVINLSLRYLTDYSTLRLAISDAITKGVVVVAAAGNDSDDGPAFPAMYAGYPANNNLSLLISVGATNQNNQRSQWNTQGDPGSNYGSWVTLYAPGTSIATTGLTGYVSCDGTSCATPFVAGTASLMLAINPSLTPAQIKTIITGTAVFTGNTDPDGNPIFILDMGAAVGRAILGVPQVTILTDRNAFIGDTGPNTIATFDDVAVGASAPFVSNGVSFPVVNGPAGCYQANPSSPFPCVVNQLAGLSDSFWFPVVGTPPNFAFLLAGFQARFPTDVLAVGFDYNCFACGTSILAWTVTDDSGTAITSGTVPAGFSSAPLFLGLICNVPFRSLSIERCDSPGGVCGDASWEADNVRYAKALAQ